LTYVTSGISTVLDWIGTVIDALLTADGALNGLAELFAVGVAISAILLGVKMIRSFIWGA
jgi:hypothetical protein